MRWLTLILVLVFSSACDDATTPLTGDYEPLPADQVVLGIDHLYTSDGVRRARLQADTAFMFKDSTSTHLRVVTLEMFDDAGELTSTLTSEAGVFNTQTQKTIARGNVVLIMPGPDGRTIWTEELHYDPSTKRVWSDVATRMLMNTGEEFHGESFTADDQFRDVNVIGGSGTRLPLPLNRQ
jgi:LPS export ABC transporter protein LptC